MSEDFFLIALRIRFKIWLFDLIDENFIIFVIWTRFRKRFSESITNLGGKRYV